MDVGDKRIGCTISDEDCSIALGLDTIKIQDVKKSLKEIFLKYNPEMIVCGIPLTMDGERGYQAKKVLGFVERLKKITNIPIVLWDERLSTKEAKRVLEGLEVEDRRQKTEGRGQRREEREKTKKNKDKRKKVVDKLASQLILQGFLDMRALILNK